MLFDLDWRVYASLALLLVIAYFKFVPSEAAKKERAERIKLKERAAARKATVGETYSQVVVTGITARRGDTTTLITNGGGDLTLTFNGIAQGNYSETIFTRLAGDGTITQYPTEALAQAAYVKGDYGILAMTMSPGVLAQRSIVPEVIHPDNSFTLEFSVRVITK